MDGKVTATGGGRYPFVGNILSGGGTSGYVVRIGIVGHVGGDEEDSRWKSYKFHKAEHREECNNKHRQYLGNTFGRRGVEGS